MVPKSQDSITFYSQIAVAPLITHVFCMLSAIYLNDQQSFAAYKVCDIGNDRFLTDNMQKTCVINGATTLWLLMVIES